MPFRIQGYVIVLVRVSNHVLSMKPQELTHSNDDSGLLPDKIPEISAQQLHFYGQKLARQALQVDSALLSDQATDEDSRAESDHSFLQSMEEFLALKARALSDIHHRLEAVKTLRKPRKRTRTNRRECA